jgi:5-methylcytosine-specific restriction endonuclease McrA
VTRKRAIAAGRKTYTGKPCKRGHGGEKYVSNWLCVECASDQSSARREAKPDERREYDRKWRAKLMSSVGHHTADEIRGLMLWQRGRCAYCKTNIKKKYHADHIIPLILGGSDLIGNIQLTCATCNHKKGGKHPVDFARYIGRLL